MDPDPVQIYTKPTMDQLLNYQYSPCQSFNFIGHKMYFVITFVFSLLLPDCLASWAARAVLPALGAPSSRMLNITPTQFHQWSMAMRKKSLGKCTNPDPWILASDQWILLFLSLTFKMPTKFFFFFSLGLSDYYVLFL